MAASFSMCSWSLFLVAILIVTTGSSDAGCTDWHAGCPGWSAAGYCHMVEYAEYMAEHCGPSCGLSCVETKRKTDEYCVEQPRVACDNEIPCCTGMTCSPKATSVGESSSRCLVDNPPDGECFDATVKCSNNKQCCTTICDKTTFQCAKQVEIKQPCVDVEDAESCFLWEILGHCINGSTIDFMHEHCTKTCDVCPGGRLGPTLNPTFSPTTCMNSDDRCGLWQMSGYCKEDPNFMELNCRLACNWCDGRPSKPSITSPSPTAAPTISNPEDLSLAPAEGECEDGHMHCNAWRKLGHCTFKANIMSAICPRACALCIPTFSPTSQPPTKASPTSAADVIDTPLACINNRLQCNRWAKLGRCYGGMWSSVMQEDCRAACYLCIPADESSQSSFITTSSGTMYTKQASSKSCGSPRFEDVTDQKMTVNGCADACDLRLDECLAFVFIQANFSCRMYRLCDSKPHLNAFHPHTQTFLRSTNNVQSSQSDTTASSSKSRTTVETATVHVQESKSANPLAREEMLWAVIIIVFVGCIALVAAAILVCRYLEAKRNHNNHKALNDLNGTGPADKGKGLDQRHKTMWDAAPETKLMNPLYSSYCGSTGDQKSVASDTTVTTPHTIVDSLAWVHMREFQEADTSEQEKVRSPVPGLSESLDIEHQQRQQLEQQQNHQKQPIAVPRKSKQMPPSKPPNPPRPNKRTSPSPSLSDGEYVDVCGEDAYGKIGELGKP